ncbi:hypothetical protein QE152_g22755 [Popillia japonica]|uniref:Uncharacterized protein n=1 Tax=Popillia japonica TaxID=7064 RepID=A0AAW1KJY6_POPJA
MRRHCKSAALPFKAVYSKICTFIHINSTGAVPQTEEPTTKKNIQRNTDGIFSTGAVPQTEEPTTKKNIQRNTDGIFLE